jgi:hypothetical protein
MNFVCYFFLEESDDSVTASLHKKKSSAKIVTFAIVRTMLSAPCFANVGAFASARKVQK